MKLNRNYTIISEFKQARIAELYAQKTALLDKWGIFGGGQMVNAMHDRINKELESLGIEPNS
jgi:hypothetical protein